MTKIIKCDCGYVARADNDGELVKVAQQHAREVHDMEITADQALSLAVPVDD